MDPLGTTEIVLVTCNEGDHELAQFEVGKTWPLTLFDKKYVSQWAIYLLMNFSRGWLKEAS